MPDFHVDICAAILADKPPQLPLREELNSLGFEVIYNAAGTGVKAIKHDSKRNVEKFRKKTQINDLRKRRFFPKSSRRIKAKLAERKKAELDLALPHACSYEAYGKELIHDHIETSTSDDSSYFSFDEGRARKRWGMFKRRQKQQKLQQQQQKQNAALQSAKSDSDFHTMVAQAEFPDFLAPTEGVVPRQQQEESGQPVKQSPPESELRDRWKEAFAALDALSHDDASVYPQPHETGNDQNGQFDTGTMDTVARPEEFKNVASLVFQATHVLDDEKSKNEQQQQGVAAINWVSHHDINAVNSGTSATTGVFDGIDTDGENTCAADDKRVVRHSSSEPNKSSTVIEQQKAGQAGEAKKESNNKAEGFTGAFENVPLDLYAGIGSHDVEKAEKPPKIDVDINFDESFVIQLAEEKTPKSSNAPKVQGVFENIASELYEKAGMVSPTTDTKEKINDNVIGQDDRPEKETKDNTAWQEGDLKVVGVVAQETEQKVENAAQENKMQNAFDRATAEICKAVGIEKPGTNQEAKQEGQTQDGPIEWFASSAKHAFDNFSSGIFKVTGIDQQENDKAKAESTGDARTPFLSSTEIGDISGLLKLISQVGTPAHAIEGVLHTSPELLQVRHQQDGRLPLHAICDRGMPDRSSIPESTLTDYLLKDIASCMSLVKSAVTLYPGACLVQDKRLDLPVHLMARNLMEWEATWYETVYQRAANERGASTSTAAAITKLYHAMSLTVESLMSPFFKNISLSSSLCRAPGSMGTILPLHIATIFTVSVKTLRFVLAAYPEAATIHCDLGILRTFIPDECLPLELHDNLSTDFPKWEVEAKKRQGTDRSEIEENAEDCMRRSDLLFAYNPIEPHRFEKARIRRIESRIQFDATMILGKTSKTMNRANELLWIWMCTFREPDSDRPTYVNSVKRIVSTLSFQSIRYLASVKTKEGGLILDAANPECLKVIQQRLEHITDETQASQSLTSSQDQALTRFSPDKYIVSHICRLVFNVPVTSYPTSFIILPYKLSKSEDGVFGLASPEFSKVATKFAECLLNMTDPRTILHVLDTKSLRHYDQSLYDSTADDTFYLETIARIDGYEKSLLSLYESGSGYLYLIDETTGLPQVTVSDTIYPVVLSDPRNVVRKLLPIMLMGMVLMRGDKAIPKLINVLLNKRVAVVPPYWDDAATMLADYVDANQVGDTALTKSSLRRFKASCPSKQRATREPKNGASEWTAELNALKKLLDANDPDQLYSGLPVPLSTATLVSPKQGEQTDEESEGPAVDDLSRKMQELAQIQSKATCEQRSLPMSEVESRSYSFDDVLIGNTFSVVEEKIDTDTPIIKLIDDPKGRKHMVSKYSLLFDDLAIEDKPEETDEQRDVEESDLRIWNASERVWEEVTCQLNTRAGTFCEDSQILQLKVALAEQAKKLAQLGKKVSTLKDEEERLFSHEDELRECNQDQETHASDYASRDSLSSARKLVHRMCDLEERLVCDEIKIQHLSMETYQLEHEGEEITTCFGERRGSRFRPENISFLTLRGNTNAANAGRVNEPEQRWGFNNGKSIGMRHSSFIKQENRANKVVRFDDSPLPYNPGTSMGCYSDRGSSSNESSSTESVQYLMTVGGDTGYATNMQNQSNSFTKASTTAKPAFSSDLHPTLEPRKSSTSSSSHAESSRDYRDTRSTEAIAPTIPLGTVMESSSFTELPEKGARYSPPQKKPPTSRKSEFRSTLQRIRNKDVLDTCCEDVEGFLGLKGSGQQRKQRLPAASKSFDSMAGKSTHNKEKYSEAMYQNYERVCPGESVSEVTDTVTSTESVFRKSRPTRTITIHGPLPPRGFSGLSDRTGSSDFAISQKEVEIDNLISKYTTEANSRITSSAAWMEVHGPVIDKV